MAVLSSPLRRDWDHQRNPSRMDCRGLPHGAEPALLVSFQIRAGSPGRGGVRSLPGVP